ncbi:MAG: GC-type dockerin domain-anchored protein [Phycisphaerales bacterium JB064]
MRLLTAAVLALPAATLAQSSIWVNYESDGALEATGFASSAVRMPDSLRIAADDFEIGSPTTTTITEIVFYSVWIDPPVILGGDWYIYEFDEATRAPGALIIGQADTPIEIVDSGLISSSFGTIYRNTMVVDVPLEAGKYFLGFRTHCAPGGGKPVNAPLHPEWTNGSATAQWNFSAQESGQVLEAWMPMTAFHPTEKEWAFELNGIVGLDCIADLDQDGSLTIFDFLMFQNLFDAGDPIADFDGDGSLTLFDFLAFQNAFDLGCE